MPSLTPRPTARPVGASCATLSLPPASGPKFSPRGPAPSMVRVSAGSSSRLSRISARWAVGRPCPLHRSQHSGAAAGVADEALAARDQVIHPLQCTHHGLLNCRAVWQMVDSRAIHLQRQCGICIHQALFQHRLLHTFNEYHPKISGALPQGFRRSVFIAFPKSPRLFSRGPAMHHHARGPPVAFKRFLRSTQH